MELLGTALCRGLTAAVQIFFLYLFCCLIHKILFLLLFYLLCDATLLTWFLFVPLQKSWQPDEDVSDTVPRDRTLKSVTFQETVNVISASPAVMEVESQQIQRGCLSSAPSRQHVAGMQEAPDGVVVQVRCP